MKREKIISDAYISYEGVLHIGDVDLVMFDENNGGYNLSLNCQKKESVFTRSYEVVKSLREEKEEIRKCPCCFQGRER